MKQKIYTVLLAFILLFISFSMIIFPETSLDASIRGLDMWWGIVFPSLLPFFIAAELLIRFGVVKFIGVLFEPIMRPLFNIPGIGSFAWMIGMASGYPSGAKISAMLREKKQISQIEAERLVSFTNTASPLFIFGALAVGLFHQAELGILLAASHYAGNILVGFVMRFYRKKEEPTLNSAFHHKNERNIAHRAFQNMHRTRLEKKQPLGQIIGESVTTSVQTLLMIGGFIILFSVFTSLLQETDITVILQTILAPIFTAFKLPVALIPAMFTGIFEITLGSDMISELKDASIGLQLIAVSFVLGFNGFSIHAQVASILSNTDIRYKAYLYGRLMHAVFSSVICWLAFKLYINNSALSGSNLPASLSLADSKQPLQWLHYMYNIGPIFTICSILTAAVYLISQRLQHVNDLK